MLCINLSHATKRWANVVAGVGQVMPKATLHRIEAVDWRSFSSDLGEVSLTLFSRYLIQYPACQERDRLSHRQLDTPSSVAIMLSHVRCWEWLRAHPEVPCCVILEDDACFDPGFIESWQRSVVPLLQHPADWDVLLLGYTLKGIATDATTTLRGVQLRTNRQWYGMHAYIVTQAALGPLLRHVFPMDLQSDGLMLTLHELGYLRLYMLPHSVSTQCMNEADRGGSWHTHTVTTTTTESTSMRHMMTSSDNSTVPMMIIVMVTFLLVLVSYRYWYLRPS